MNSHEIATKIYEEFCETLKADPNRAKVVLISKIQIALREKQINDLIVAAKMLLENSRLCMLNHHAYDEKVLGLPDWFKECQDAIARAQLAAQEGGEG